MLRSLLNISALECWDVHGIFTARNPFHIALQMDSLSDLVWYTVFQQLPTMFQPDQSMHTTILVIVQVGSLIRTLKEMWFLTHLRMVCLLLKGSGHKVTFILCNPPRCLSLHARSLLTELDIPLVVSWYPLEFHWKLNLPSTMVRILPLFLHLPSILVLLSNRHNSSR